MDALSETMNIAAQVAYWKSLARDTFWMTLKKAVIHSLLFTLLFLMAGVVIYDLAVTTFGAEFKILTVALGPVYLLIGALHGLSYGVISTLRRKTPEIEQGVDMTVNPLVSELVKRIPLGEERIGITQARSFLQKKVGEILDASQPEFRALSPMRFLYNFTLRRALTKLSRDFLKKLEETGERELTKAAIERFAKEKLIGTVADDLKRQLVITHYSVLVLSGLLLLGPVIVILVFRTI